MILLSQGFKRVPPQKKQPIANNSSWLVVFPKAPIFGESKAEARFNWPKALAALANLLSYSFHIQLSSSSGIYGYLW